MSFEESEWRKLARRVAVSCGLGPDDADDAEQEGALKAWELRDGPSGRIALSVVNKVIDHARKVWRARNREAPLDDLERCEDVDKFL